MNGDLSAVGCTIITVVDQVAIDPYLDGVVDAFDSHGIPFAGRLLRPVGEVENAALFAFPSLYEGFGLPVLEAMACGVPVVCSNASSLPEVAGDAALLVDPVDTDGLAGAMGRVLEDGELREEMIARGLVQAARFTWDGAARQLLAVFGALGRM